MNVYTDQRNYSDGFAAGYAQAISDADLALKKAGDDHLTRICRRDILALVTVPFNPDEVAPMPDWTRYTVPKVPDYRTPRVNGDDVQKTGGGSEP